MGYFKLGDETYEVDEKNSFINETTDDYKTLWDIRIESKKNDSNNSINFRGDKVIVPEFCLSQWAGRKTEADNYFFCEDEDIPFSLYNYEHFDTCENKIEFGSIDGDAIEIKWTGRMDLSFGERLEENDCFEIRCKIRINSMISPGEFVSPSLHIQKVIENYDSLSFEEKESALWGFEDILDCDNIYLTSSSINALENFLPIKLKDNDELSESYQDLTYFVENLKKEN